MIFLLGFCLGRGGGCCTSLVGYINLNLRMFYLFFVKVEMQTFFAVVTAGLGGETCFSKKINIILHVVYES